jgi:hypothetical protein
MDQMTGIFMRGIDIAGDGDPDGGTIERWQETGLEELAARIAAMGREVVEPFF